MTGRDAGDDPEATGQSMTYESFALALQDAYYEVRLHSPQAVPEVEERLRSKLVSHGVKLTPAVLRAVAFAIVNDRGF